MKSRLAVSLLFILIAAAFTSDATAAFEKLRSWTGKIRGCWTAQVCNCLTPRDSALISDIRGKEKGKVTMIHPDRDGLPLKRNCATASQPRVVRTISPEGNNITCNSADATKLVSSREVQSQGLVFKLVGSHNHREAFDFITTAARQIHELLSLMRIK